MSIGMQGAGGPGLDNNYKVFNITTSGTPNEESNQDTGQAVFNTLLINDSDTDILVGFDNATTVSNKVWTLKAGEILSVDLVYQTLYYKCAAASKAFRLLVIW